MCDTHTEDICIFCKVLGVEESLIQKIVSALEEAYLVYIRYHAKISINMLVYELLTHHRNTYGKLTTQNILKREDVVNRNS